MSDSFCSEPAGRRCTMSYVSLRCSLGNLSWLLFHLPSACGPWNEQSWTARNGRIEPSVLSARPFSCTEDRHGAQPECHDLEVPIPQGLRSSKYTLGSTSQHTRSADARSHQAHRELPHREIPHQGPSWQGLQPGGTQDGWYP